MKFHLSAGPGNRFTAHGEGFVRVNAQEYRENVLVLPDRVVAGWTRAGGIDELVAEDLAAVAQFTPEVVVLGTGRAQRFPHPAVLRPLIAASIGFEVMDTPAACRTFNILSAEGRVVAAALLLDQAPSGTSPRPTGS